MKEILQKAGALSLASAAALGWLIALQHLSPAAIRKIGIKAPKKVMSLHLDQVMMGVILLSVSSAVPDLPSWAAKPLVVGCIANPLLFIPMAFEPESSKWLTMRAASITSFLFSTTGFFGLAYHVWKTR